jgi:hypothetical protein
VAGSILLLRQILILVLFLVLLQLPMLIALLVLMGDDDVVSCRLLPAACL